VSSCSSNSNCISARPNFFFKAHPKIPGDTPTSLFESSCLDLQKSTSSEFERELIAGHTVHCFSLTLFHCQFFLFFSFIFESFRTPLFSSTGNLFVSHHELFFQVFSSYYSRHFGILCKNQDTVTSRPHSRNTLATLAREFRATFADLSH
jgi:hypothetical protein